MTSAAARDPEAPDGPLPGDPSRGAGWRLPLLVALVVVLLASTAASLVLWAPWEGDDAAGGAGEVQAEREVVMDHARQFMLAVNTYGPDLLAEDGTMPDYREQIGELITPKFRTDFEESVVVAEQIVAQADLAREAVVHGTGVSEIDEDSATVLVAGAFTNSYPRGGEGRRAEERVEQQPAPFRVEVGLVRTGGEWLVDDFTPVTGEAAP